VLAGFAAAFSDANPGLPIGVGGRPPCRRVLYGVSRFSSDCFNGSLQFRSTYRIVASMNNGSPTSSRL
jgi:hypothetical protein